MRPDGAGTIDSRLTVLADLPCGYFPCMSGLNGVLSSGESKELLGVLKARFEKQMSRHSGVEWSRVQAKLEAHPAKLWSLNEMERTGGEPDLMGEDLFVDCSPESPEDRRSLCYDQQALDERKEHKPEGSAVSRASEMGVELLTEEQYRQLQTLGEFDLKTSSWLKTPDEVRKHGGSIFGDRRYDRVFVYHNGAQSYYASRGFRSCIRV